MFGKIVKSCVMSHLSVFGQCYADDYVLFADVFSGYTKLFKKTDLALLHLHVCLFFASFLARLAFKITII